MIEIPREWYDTYIEHIEYMHDQAVMHGSKMTRDEFIVYAFKYSSGYV